MKTKSIKKLLCPICKEPIKLASKTDVNTSIEKHAVHCSNNRCLLYRPTVWCSTKEDAVDTWQKDVIQGKTITVEFDDETDVLIRENAEKLGISPEQYITDIVLNQFIDWIKIINEKNSQ